MLEIATIKNYKKYFIAWMESLIAGLDEGPGLVTRDITFSFYAFLWRRCTTCNF